MLRESSASYLASTGGRNGGVAWHEKGYPRRTTEQEKESKRRSLYWCIGEKMKASETTTEDVKQSGGLRETKVCVNLIFTIVIVIVIPTATKADT